MCIGHLWHTVVSTNCSISEFYMIADDPLGKCVAVWAGPVSVLLDKRVVAWRGFKFLNNERSLIPLPLLDQSRRPIAHPLIGSQKILMKMPPARIILMRILPNFPAVTNLLIAPFNVL